MNVDISTFAVGFFVGVLLGLTATAVALGDRQVEISQRELSERELVKHGFAYYTIGPSGYPVFKMKDSK